MTSDEQKAEVEAVMSQILADRGGPRNPTFVARDLGFSDHTKIHEAAREIIARYVAQVVVLDRLYGR